MYGMLDGGAGLSTENYDATLASWSAQSLQSNVVFSAGDSTYCEAENERQSIIMNFSWTIEDVGKDCDTPDPTQQPLILKVRTDAPQGSGGGIDNSSRFNVRAGGSGSVFTVDCDNDGTPEFTNVSSSVMCDYSNHGQYEVAITGTYHHMDGKSGFGDNYKIVDIVQWGDLEWSSMDSMFYRAYNLTDISASDTPDLSQVTSVEGMFEEAESFNGNINDWDVSNVTNMRLMFINATAFNQPLNGWDVSNVTDMAGMFASARSFNQPLNDWDVGSVTNTTAMFNGAFAFDSSLAGWDVSNVTSMAGMFAGAISFNQPLNSWDTGNVETMDSMFFTAIEFNQPLNSWDVSSVQNMRIMFAMASSFNQNINSWEVSSVTNMAAMFTDEFAFTGIMMGTNDEPLEIGGTTIIPQPMSFNQPLNNWDVSNVSIMAGMFFGLRSFNQPLNDWDVSNVTNMGILFMLASSFNQPLNNWDVSNVTDFSFSGYVEELTGEAMDPDDAPYNFSIFSYALSFNSSVAGWDVSSARNTAGMFSGAKTFNQPLTNWNTTGVQNMSDMFSMTLAFDQPLDNLDVSQVTRMRTFLGGTDTLIESLELDAGMPIEDMPQEEKDKVFGLFSAFLDETVDQSNYQNFAAGLSTANYDATLANWNGQSLQNNVTLDAGTSTYCASSAARQNMISARNWTINDEGEDCDSQPGDRPFIIKVDTTFGDGSNQVTIPTSSTDYSYNYNVDCNNDGTPDFVDQTADVTCIYGSSGQYDIAISGVFPHWRGSGAAVQASIVDVVQWGDIEWRNMEWMFSDADELALFSAADDPDLSEVQSLSYMFAGADTFNADIQHWDVSNVTNMSGMFASVQSFNLL
jgi:surface protein